MSLNYFEAEHHVSTYNRFRPCPPKDLVECIVQYATEKISEPLEIAVDVGCGSGQSTEMLAPYFKKIFGYDLSGKIINEARKKCHHLNIYYSVSQGEKMDLNDESADVVTVSQALHWFDLPKFYREAERCLKTNGVLAIFGYSLPVPMYRGSPEIETLIEKYYTDVLADFTLPQSRKVYIEKYTTKEFNEIDFIQGGKMKRLDHFVQETEGTVNDLTGYMSSWSAFQNYTKQLGEENGQKLLQNFKNDFKNLAKNEFLERFKIKYNYFLLLGRKK